MGGTPSFGQEAEARVKREPRPRLLLGFPWETQGELVNSWLGLEL